jgi:hypothetical protein
MTPATERTARSTPHDFLRWPSSPTHLPFQGVAEIVLSCGIPWVTRMLTNRKFCRFARRSSDTSIDSSTLRNYDQ